MELSEEHILEKYGERCGHVNQKFFFHTNTSLLVFRVDSS